MPFSVNSPNVEEARLYAILGVLTANLSTLNGLLTYDGLWPSNVPITANMCDVGVPQTGYTKSQRPMYFGVVGGIEGNPWDVRSAYIYMDTPENTSGIQNWIETNIFVYIHQDAIGGYAQFEQEKMRQLVRARCSDWLRAGVFNSPRNRRIFLRSQEYQAPNASPPTYDYLDYCIIHASAKEHFPLDYMRTQMVAGLHAVHQGQVIGSFTQGLE